VLFLVELKLLSISFLIIYAMCSCMDLVVNVMFW
jgi:hypothetical protein